MNCLHQRFDERWQGKCRQGCQEEPAEERDVLPGRQLCAVVSTSRARPSLEGVNDQTDGLGDAKGEWYFCFKHNKVEMRHECKRMDRMGPYPTPEDAENWRARVAARNASWEAQEKDE